MPDPVQQRRPTPTMPDPVQQRRPPSESAATRARADHEAARAAHRRAVASVERARAAWARAEASAHALFTCPGCGLKFPRRRAADPLAVPLRCLCCAFLLTIADARAREAVRRVLGRAELQHRFGGRDAPPAAQGSRQGFVIRHSAAHSPLPAVIPLK